MVAITTDIAQAIIAIKIQTTTIDKMVSFIIVSKVIVSMVIANMVIASKDFIGTIIASKDCITVEFEY